MKQRFSSYAMILTGCFVWISPLAAAESCSALLQIANDLYIVGEDGNIDARLTTDSSKKLSPSLSADANRAVFIAGDRQLANEFIVVNREGVKAVVETPNADGMSDMASLIGVTWNGADTVIAKKHVGPQMSEFQFYKLSDASTGSEKFEEAAPFADGFACVAAYKSVTPGCIMGDSVEVAGHEIYSEDPFVTAPVIDEFSMRIGDVHSIKGVERVNVALSSIDTTAFLKFNVDGIDGAQAYVPYDTTTALQLSDGSTLTVTPSRASGKSDQVLIRAKRLDDDVLVLDNGLAWFPNDSNVAVVKQTEGRRSLLAIPSTMSAFTKPAEFPLNLRERVRSLLFVSDSKLLVQGDREAQLYLVESDANGTPIGVKYARSLPIALEVHLDDRSITASVDSWACR